MKKFSLIICQSWNLTSKTTSICCAFFYLWRWRIVLLILTKYEPGFSRPYLDCGRYCLVALIFSMFICQLHVSNEIARIRSWNFSIRKIFQNCLKKLTIYYNFSNASAISVLFEEKNPNSINLPKMWVDVECFWFLKNFYFPLNLGRFLQKLKKFQKNETLSIFAQDSIFSKKNAFILKGFFPKFPGRTHTGGGRTSWLQNRHSILKIDPMSFLVPLKVGVSSVGILTVNSRAFST